MPKSKKIPIPKEFRCPITFMIMREPVVASDGEHYEKDYIESHLKNNNHSPVIGYEFKIEQKVHPDNFLKNRINNFLSEHPELFADGGKDVYIPRHYWSEIEAAVISDNVSRYKDFVKLDPRLATLRPCDSKTLNSDSLPEISMQELAIMLRKNKIIAVLNIAPPLEQEKVEKAAPPTSPPEEKKIERAAPPTSRPEEEKVEKAAPPTNPPEEKKVERASPLTNPPEEKKLERAAAAPPAEEKFAPTWARIAVGSTMFTTATGVASGISAAIRGGDVNKSASVVGLGTGILIGGLVTACKYRLFPPPPNNQSSARGPSFKQHLIGMSAVELIGASIGSLGAKLFINTAVSTAPFLDGVLGTPISVGLLLCFKFLVDYYNELHQNKQNSQLQPRP